MVIHARSHAAVTASEAETDDDADAVFAAAFVQAYAGDADPQDALGWARNPDAPGPTGAPSPHHQFRALQPSVYGPVRDASVIAAAEDAQRQIAEIDRAVQTADERVQLWRTVEASIMAPPPGSRFAARLPTSNARSAPTRTRQTIPIRRVVVLLSAVALLAGAAGSAVGFAAHTTPVETSSLPKTQQAVLTDTMSSAGALTALDYFRAYPQAMPRLWQGIQDGTVFRRHTNVLIAPLHVSGVAGAVLVTVTCPAIPAHGYEWAIRSDNRILATGGGRCGVLRPQEGLLSGAQGQKVTLGVNVPGGDGYSVTVLQR